MKIILFRPQPDANLNDTFIEYGTKVILKEVLGNSIYFQNVYFEPLNVETLPSHDLIVVCGTPWIWDQCTKSIKYQELMTLLNQSDKPKIGMGLGSCFPLEMNFKAKLRIKSRVPNLDYVLGFFDYVFVRDKLAAKICKTMAKKAKLLCCPSVFAKEFINFLPLREKNDLVFFYAPQFGLSGGVLNNNFVKHYIDLQVDYARKYQAKVICINEDEFELANSIGLNVKLFKTPSELASELSGAKTLLSGRVHGCMFTVGACIPAALLPVDTRFLTYRYCGGKIIMTDKISNISYKDLHPCKFNYINEKKKWKKFLTFSLESTGLL